MNIDKYWISKKYRDIDIDTKHIISAHTLSVSTELSDVIKYDQIDNTINKMKSFDTINNYIVEKMLGSGAYGSVMLCRLDDRFNNMINDNSTDGFYGTSASNTTRKIKTNNRYAIKRMDKMGKSYDMAKIKMEILTQSQLNHPGIVKCYKWFESADNVYLVLDYIEGKNLFEVMTQWNYKIPHEKVRFYMKQMLDILMYLKQNNVVHKDIKPENILIDKMDKLYLCDFGFSRILTKESPYCIIDHIIGTPDYVSPEIIQLAKHDYATDMWGFGVMLYELTYGEQPFYHKSVSDTYRNIMSKSIESILALALTRYDPTKSYRSLPYLRKINKLIKKILVNDPLKRITIEQCFEEEYFLD